jgi:hypothetical protein
MDFQERGRKDGLVVEYREKMSMLRVKYKGQVQDCIEYTLRPTSTTLSKMHFTYLALTALSLLLTTAQALGRAIITNECDDPIYLWSVGGSISPQHTLLKDTSYSEPFHLDPLSGGIALKLSPVENGIFKPNASQTIFAYNLDGDTVWYDMSDLFGDGFAGRTLKIAPTDESCESVLWGAGKAAAKSGIRNCGAGADLELSICTVSDWRLVTDLLDGN